MLPQFTNLQFVMLACCSPQHWVQIKLSASVPTFPEGVTTHTVLSYEQTLLHAAGLQQLPKAREEKNRETMWSENVGQKDSERRWGKEKKSKWEQRRTRNKKNERRWKMAGGQHADAQDLTGIFWIAHRQSSCGALEKVWALRMFCPTASPRSVAGR